MTRKKVLLSFGVAVPILSAMIYSSDVSGILHQNLKFELKEKTSSFL